MGPDPGRAAAFPRIIILAATAVVVAACGTAADDSPPAVGLAPYHTAVEGIREGAPAALDRWWTGFNDPVLTGIVERALAQNLDLEAALARVLQARAAAQGAGARLLPAGQVDSRVSPQRQALYSPIGSVARHLPGYSRDQTLYDLGAGASWEIDLGGGLQHDADAAAALAEAAQAEQLGSRVMIAADAADAYLQVRGFQARLALAAAQIGQDERWLGLVRLRQVRGIATLREVAQSEALLAQARAIVPPLRDGLARQLNRLDVLMAAQPGRYAGELATVADVPALPGIDAGHPDDLLRRRPDVIAAERRLVAAQAMIGSALSDYYPKVTLSSLLGFESLNGQRLLTGAAFQPQAVAGVQWRLFDFGRVDAAVEAATGAKAEAWARYRQAMLKATQDVEDALSALGQSLAETQELAQETAALTRARASAQEAYLGGAVSLIDVLDADRQLLLAEDSLAATRTDSARAAVSTFRALGGGW
jgi:NodT family efflux transporter outer membrane factor (OMF) lipoprotein